MTLALILVVTICIAIGFSIGWWLSHTFFGRRLFTSENAVELLKIGRPEEWNEVRVQNSSWVPDLRGVDLHDASLPGVDFRNALLDEADLSGAVLDAARFDHASLVNSNLKRASLVDTSFEEANLIGADLTEANLRRTFFRGANLKGSKASNSISTEPEVFEPNIMQLMYGISKNPNAIDDMNPMAFERFVAQLFLLLGYETNLASLGSYKGYDIELTKEEDIGKTITIVEVKKYQANRPIGISVLRGLVGVVLLRKANRGLLVTSSYLSRGAQEFINEFQILDVINRDKLIDLVKKAVRQDSNGLL